MESPGTYPCELSQGRVTPWTGPVVFLSSLFPVQGTITGMMQPKLEFLLKVALIPKQTSKISSVFLISFLCTFLHQVCYCDLENESLQIRPTCFVFSPNLQTSLFKVFGLICSHSRWHIAAQSAGTPVRWLVS